MKFETVAMMQNNPKWKNAIKREEELYSRNNEIRTDFERDYTRVINCNAYRRLKHKTQVFFSPESDHICTRIEHVAHVESISYTIAKHLGLNTELTKAIAKYLLIFGSVCPKNVVYQGQKKNGSSVYKSCPVKGQKDEIFCYE